MDIALSDAEKPTDQVDFDFNRTQEGETDPNSIEIQNKLDSFFIGVDEEPAESAAGPHTTVDEIEQSLFFNEEDGVQSALADSEEEQGFSEETEAATLSFTPMDEIEEKLDFFFGTDADGESEVDEYQHQTAPSDVLEETLDLTFGAPDIEPSITPALDGFATLETGDDREKSIFTEKGQQDEALEGTLDRFFTDAQEEKNEPIATAVDELTSALEASIDNGQQTSTSDSKQIQLAALGALLPIVVRTPSLEKIVEATTLIATIQKADSSAEQQSLAQLLDSVITMSVRLPTKDDAATEKLVNFLYEQLIAEHSPPAPLSDAVTRYTAWLQQASGSMPVILAAADQEQEPQFAYTAKELYFELSELRTHMRDEFAKLRHEMHHLKT
jgi:pilus assembly protein FimV